MKYLRKKFKSLASNLYLADARLTAKRNAYVIKMNERGWEVFDQEYRSNHEHILRMRKH